MFLLGVTNNKSFMLDNIEDKRIKNWLVVNGQANKFSPDY
jgi:hypothetical protein